MPLFVALSSRGLGSVLAKDATRQDLKIKTVKSSWISFESSWLDVTKFILNSGALTRVLRPLLECSCYNQDDLYHNVQKIDFTKYIEPDGTLRVRVVGHSTIFRDTRFVAQKVKDAVVDQFSKKYGKRPDVAPKNADLAIHIILNNEKVSVNLDIAGFSLSQRGYRTEAGEAPLREHLAAGLIDLAEIDFSKPVLDPMCGSGTLIIESIARCFHTNLLKADDLKQISFLRWKNLESSVKDGIVKLISNHVSERKSRFSELSKSQMRFFASDHHPKMIEIAQRNVERAGLKDCVSFKQVSLSDLTPPTESGGTMILNPPYGERLSDKKSLEELYYSFGTLLRERFKGWTVWILSGDAETTSALRLKSSQKIPMKNGTIDCRWIKYEVF